MTMLVVTKGHDEDRLCCLTGGTLRCQLKLLKVRNLAYAQCRCEYRIEPPSTSENLNNIKYAPLSEDELSHKHK